MMWIFKVTRWTHNRRMKINKYPTVSNGIRASSFEIWTEKLCSVAYPGHPNKCTELHLWRFKLEILLSWLLCGHIQIPDFGIFLNVFFFGVFFFFFNLLDIQEQCICKLEKKKKKKVSWNLSGVYYWFLKLDTGIICHSYFPSHGNFTEKGQRQAWGQMDVECMCV